MTVDDLDEFVTAEQMHRRLLAAERAKSETAVELRLTKALLKEAEAETARAHKELSLYDREWKGKVRQTASKSAKSDHRGTLVSILSDTHYGEVVDKREMGGSNAYNMEIAEQRTARYFDKLISLPQTYLTGVDVEGITVCLGGDIVSGDIHDELTETNELSTYETVETVLPWLLAGLTKLRERYPSVHVVSAPGNHGRRTRKPHAKRFSADNADTHIARLIAQTLGNEDGYAFTIPRSLDADFTVYNTRFSLEHGQTFRGGDGQVGALGPVKRGVLRKKQSSQAEGNPFDVLLLGHFHQLVHAPGQGFIMNGSLVGYGEYARTLKFAPEPAQQALFLVTPEHSVSWAMPVIVQ